MKAAGFLRSMPMGAMVLALVACSPQASPSGDQDSASQRVTKAFLPGDLAVAFALKDSAMPRASDALPSGRPLLDKSTYAAVVGAFTGTVAEGGFGGENIYEDTRLVSLRIAPCSPLGPTPTSDIDRLCWPELRLVFQPVVSKIRVREVYSETYADDRSIHVLYDVPTSLALTDEEGRRASDYLRRIRAASLSPSGTFAPLSTDELTDFESLRDRITGAYLESARRLRAVEGDTAGLERIAARAESLGGTAEQRAFQTRVREFLGRTLLSATPSQVTAFSLPPGRGPADMDAWVFVSLAPSGRGFSQESHTIRSIRTGQVIFRGGNFFEASMTTDSQDLQDALATGPHAADLAQTVAVTPDQVSRLAGALGDRRQILVPNTACASCHRLGEQRFDFHAFSYLEDRDLSVSPRVINDVNLDLAWIAARLGKL